MAGQTAPEAVAVVSEIEHAAHGAALLMGNLRVLDLGVLEEAVVRHHVRPRVEKDTIRGSAVAPGATDFLVVALDRARHVAVEYEADVGLVDPHAEGDGRA